MTFRTTLACAAFVLAAGCGKGPDVTNGTVPVAAATGARPPAGQKWTDVVSQTAEGGYRMGNPDAPLKLVEYGSRTCPTCGAFGQSGMRPLEDRYVTGGKVSYEFRDFMVHAPDLGVAVLGQCAGAAPFFPLLEQMYLGQPAFLDKLEAASKDQAFVTRVQALSPVQATTMWVDRLGYVDFMKQHGMTEVQARACLADPKRIDAVTALTKRGSDDQEISGTPTFILNGQKLDNQVVWPQIEQALKAAGA
ncbi:DsbA family protein [Sphingomonas bacterium]|uniref:DsbA family protein n=1 Tax=Sphingomonas bacterium TaxID=1895847 RepID=UPI0015771142|nr:thioredoxin domain-containing protein [Sphingomonas bacterium]